MTTKFYYFKPSGKYYTEGEGNFPSDPKELGRWLFDRQAIRDANKGEMPGLSSGAEEFFVVVVPSEDNEQNNAWPRLLLPV